MLSFISLINMYRHSIHFYSIDSNNQLPFRWILKLKNKDFTFIHFFSDTLFFLYVDHSFWPLSTSFLANNSFVSFKTCMVAMIHSILFENVFIYYSLLKSNFIGYRIILSIEILCGKHGLSSLSHINSKVFKMFFIMLKLPSWLVY